MSLDIDLYILWTFIISYNIRVFIIIVHNQDKPFWPFVRSWQTTSIVDANFYIINSNYFCSRISYISNLVAHFLFEVRISNYMASFGELFYKKKCQWVPGLPAIALQSPSLCFVLNFNRENVWREVNIILVLILCLTSKYRRP